MTAPVILWFRQDLRLADNPALIAATEAGKRVLPLYILDDETPGKWRRGGASRWWLHHSLADLGARLDRLGAPLLLRRGTAGQVLAALVEETGASAVYWNRRYEPAAVAADTAIKAALAARGVRAHSFNTALLFEPWEIRTKGDEPFKVYSPFWRACLAKGPPPAAGKAPREIAGVTEGVRGDSLDDWALLPKKPDWAHAFPANWKPGEDGAARSLDAFLSSAIATYDDDRDRPDLDGTSQLSPHLHFGEIGPRQVWQAVQAHIARNPRHEKGGAKLLSEIGWREFSYHLLHQTPHLPDRCFRPEFDSFPWSLDTAALTAWQMGRTGFPIVDAGMRQLWRIGWMHNRVRMIAASLLVKHLLVPWQSGAAWFWDTLVDADLASNSANWQWVAGCGADAAPYFRIFNPVLQGEKFDPDGRYVTTWLPELKGLPAKYIHRPWDAPPGVLADAGIKLGLTYPRPIIDLARGRDRALAAFGQIQRRPEMDAARQPL